MFKLAIQGLALGVILLAQPSITPDSYPTEWKNKGRGKTFVLYRKHNTKTMNQGRVGSCVGASMSKALELLHGQKFSAEWCYGISRSYFGIENGGGGSWCAYCAQAMKDVGALPSRNYSILGWDLSEYDWKTAKTFERGPPESLKVIADGYKTGFVKIKTWEQFRDAIATGHPIVVGSNVGFGSTSATRSKSGLLRSQWWSKWNHAMCFCGVSDGKSKRALILNSWGENWVSGPKWLGDEPEGSFWILKSDVLKMLAQDDVWAILPIKGLPR